MAANGKTVTLVGATLYGADPPNYALYGRTSDGLPFAISPSSSQR
jgi:hypothetical protein